MNELIIELDRVALCGESLAFLREEFEAGGLTSGRFAIGDISAMSEMVYFLWHDSGEMPVSMLIVRDNLKTEGGTRAAANDFLLKWKRRRG